VVEEGKKSALQRKFSDWMETHADLREIIKRGMDNFNWD